MLSMVGNGPRGHCVILPANIDDHAAQAFAAQLTLHQLLGAVAPNEAQTRTPRTTAAMDTMRNLTTAPYTRA